MEEIISTKEFNDLMKLEGEVRGSAMKGYANFIFKEKGEEGVKKLEEAITKAGYPIKYKEMRALGFYPLGLEAVTLLVIKRLFNFDDKKFQEMGRFETKLSEIIRFFLMNIFVSLDKVIKEAPKMWRRGVTVGELKLVEYDKEKKYGIARLENFRLHPLHCQVVKGYFSSVLQMIIGKEVTCEETKCLFRGDEYHEFLLKW